MGIYIRGKKNRAGWPLRKKFIFDAASARRMQKATDKLHNAMMRIRETHDRSEETVYGGLYDAVTKKGDWGSTEALNILTNAMLLVVQADKNNQEAAKAKEQTS